MTARDILSTPVAGVQSADIDAVARNTNVSQTFTHFDMHVDDDVAPSDPWPVWGMVVPGQ